MGIFRRCGKKTTKENDENARLVAHSQAIVGAMRWYVLHYDDKSEHFQNDPTMWLETAIMLSENIALLSFRGPEFRSFEKQQLITLTMDLVYCAGHKRVWYEGSAGAQLLATLWVPYFRGDNAFERFDAIGRERWSPEGANDGK